LKRTSSCTGLIIIMSKDKKKLLLLDFSSETNAGDIALQEGMLKLAKGQFPEASFSVTVAYGANQDFRAGHHFVSLLQDPDLEIGGALRPTFFPLEGEKRNVYLGEGLNLFGLMIGSFLLLIMFANKTLAKILMPHSFRTTFDLLEQADFVLWKGKNFRGRSNPFLEFYRLYSRLFMPLAVIALEKPMACVGLSVWPLKYSVPRHFLRFVLAKCEHISVRESESLGEVESLLKNQKKRPEVVVTPDLSFALLRHLTPKEIEYKQEVSQIAFTIVDWSEFGPKVRENYITAIREFIEFAVDEYQCSIVIVPQVIKEWESTQGLLKILLDSLSKKAQAKVSRPEIAPSVENLVQVYKCSDYLIATRMHSAIFSLSVGTPALVIPYDKGAKWSILKDLGYSDYMIAYDEVNFPLLKEKFSELHRDKARIMKSVKMELDKVFFTVDSCLAEVKPYVEKRA